MNEHEKQFSRELKISEEFMKDYEENKRQQKELNQRLKNIRDQKLNEQQKRHRRVQFAPNTKKNNGNKNVSLSSEELNKL